MIIFPSEPSVRALISDCGAVLPNGFKQGEEIFAGHSFYHSPSPIQEVSKDAI